MTCVTRRQVVRWLTECGNGIVEGEEQCDDGNLAGGDGCSAVCKVDVPEPPHSMREHLAC